MQKKKLQQQQQFHTENMKSTMDDDLNQIVPDCIESISPKNPLLIHSACSFSFFFLWAFSNMLQNPASILGSKRNKASMLKLFQPVKADYILFFSFPMDFGSNKMIGLVE